MNDININVDSTKVLGDEILAFANDYNNIIKKIKNQVKDIQDSGIWNGIDNVQFTDALFKYFTSFENVEDTLKFYGNFLIQASSIYQTLENDYSSRSSYE